MNLKEYLESKRLKVLERIKPMCEVFGIGNYDYVIAEGSNEYLELEGITIDCTSNSIEITVQELVGFIFIHYWDRSLDESALRKIKRYWI